MSVPAIPDSGGGIVGLEDYDPSTDASTPRLKIAHADAALEDTQSGAIYPSGSTFVALGVVKQRVLWPIEVDEDPMPICRANDFLHGRPYWKEFPFDDAGIPADSVNEENPYVSCTNCQLKEWGSHPTRDVSWCTEVWNLVLATETDDGQFLPAILQVQRSGLKPLRKYYGSYARRGIPMFENYTTINLTSAKRGSVVYSVPEFVAGGPTDEMDHEDFGDVMRGIRNFLVGDRVEEQPVEVALPTTTAADAMPTGLPSTGPAGFDDDEEPF